MKAKLRKIKEGKLHKLTYDDITKTLNYIENLEKELVRMARLKSELIIIDIEDK